MTRAHLTKISYRGSRTDASFVTLTALALLGLTLGGCNGVLGIDEPVDETPNPSTTTGAGPSGGNVTTGTGSTSGGASTGGGGTGGGGSGGSGGSTTGTGGGSNGGGPDGGGRAVEFAWADWPMPNPITSGLPYPQTYDTTVTVGVVVDKVTNLKWQQTVDPNTYSWADAQAYCAGLTFAGGGWRLPSRIELLSIVDFTSPNPIIDLRVFPGTPQARFWTTSPVADDGASAWTIDFAFGNGLTYSALMTNAYRVRCVR